MILYVCIEFRPTGGLCSPVMPLHQTKEALKKVLASMISKSGKLRSLQRELKKTYTESATTEFLVPIVGQPWAYIKKRSCTVTSLYHFL